MSGYSYSGFEELRRERIEREKIKYAVKWFKRFGLGFLVFTAVTIIFPNIITAILAVICGLCALSITLD